METYVAKNRSYDVRAKTENGDLLRALDTIARNVPDGPPADPYAAWRPVTIMRGEVVKRIGESNAGFRGIEFSIKTSTGDVVHGVSAGLFDPA